MSSPSQLNLNITNDQLLLINILNTMYNDNLRQINSLTISNNEIRNTITNLLSNRDRGQSNSRVRTRNNNNYRDTLNRNVNANSAQNRSNVNQSQYIIEDIQEFRIPYSQLYNWVNNSDSTFVEPTNNNPLQSGRNPLQTGTNPLQPRRTALSRIIQSFLEPVEVFPTQTQIEIATRRAMYCDIVSPINRSCPISLENFNDSDMVSIIRHCGHIFHTDHLTTWFRTNCKCPVCRYDIRNYTAPSSQNYFSNNEPPLPVAPESSNEVENNEHHNEESQSVPPATASQNVTSFFNNIINNVNSQDIENLATLFTDSSGNLTTNVSDPTFLFTMLTRFNNSSLQ